MDPAGSPRFSAEWLELREGADAAARSAHLATLLSLPPPVVVRDLGCGSGSMARWLAPRLPAPQHWVLVDRDPELLALAATRVRGTGVTAETVRGDVAGLTAAALAGTSLVTASALLDLLTRAEIRTLATACAGAGTPALLALTVTGEVALTPADPLDDELAAGFRTHLRRHVPGRDLLGADAADAAAEEFAATGMTVHRAASPWRLGPDRSALQAEWLHGWVPAACAARPGIAAGGYLERRLKQAANGELHVTVGHEDVLAVG